MKKCLVVISVMCLALLAGCGKGNRTLDCSKSYTSSIDQRVVAKYVGNDVDTVDMIFTVKLSETSKKYIDTYLSTYKKTFENQYGKYNNVKVTAEKSGDSAIEVNVAFDFKAMSDSDKSAVGFKGSLDYDVNKESFEKSGYTCK